MKGARRASGKAMKTKETNAAKRFQRKAGLRRPKDEEGALAEVIRQRAKEPHHPIERLLRKYGRKLDC